MSFSIVIATIIFLKFSLPFFFFKLPFQASWLNFVLDTSDGDILMHFGMNPNSYQVWDKAADWVTYVLMFMAGRHWKIGKTITYLFIYRTIGQIIFFATGNDFFFFLFPNFLEPLFMIYSLLLFTDKEKAHKRYKKYLIPIWILIVTYKMWNEYNIHVAEIDLSEKYLGFNN